MRLLLVGGLAFLIVGCALSGPPVPTASERSIPTARATAVAVFECGVSDLRILYDNAGGPALCFWNLYSAGTPARWIVTKYTQEGEPIRETLSFEGGVLLMTRDMSADGFSSPADPRLWSWRCAAMTKRPFATDPQRYSFELTGCSGADAHRVGEIAQSFFFP